MEQKLREFGKSYAVSESSLYVNDTVWVTLRIKHFVQ